MEEFSKELSLEVAKQANERAKREAEEAHSFAWELIGNARRDSKRWFIIALVILSMWLTTIGMFVYHISMYDYVVAEEYDADAEDGGNASIIGGNGLILNGEGKINPNTEQNP